MLVVMPEFLAAVGELPKKQAIEVIQGIELLTRNPDDPRLNRERLAGRAAGLQSIHAGDSCRIVFAGRQVVLLRFAGTVDQIQRFVERAAAEVTAMAESPIAHQLHACADPLQVFASDQGSESPSCGAPISIETLTRLILHTRKYLPLSRLLLSRGPEISSMEMRFTEIETVLAAVLPKSARTRKQWWSNNPDQAQAHAWMAVGWKTAALDLHHEKVVFVRHS